MVATDQTAHTCCFLGHREICVTEKMKSQLLECLEDLIENKSVDTFLFGSKSQFNSLCYEITTKLKEKHPHIKRIYVRAEFPVIRESYQNYLLEKYEDTYYPENIISSGRAVYIKRNYSMIENSQFCIFYYNQACMPLKRKSGTKIALDYAQKKHKTIYIFPFAHD
jgi:uncharacterized phage-like protein YoqJ